MKKGEKGFLLLTSDYGYGAHGSPPKIPGGATLCFEVELIDFKEKEKELWEMDYNEKVEKGTACKTEATGLFQEKRFAEAASKYREVGKYFDEGGAGEDADDPFISDEGKALFVSSLNNAGMCFLKCEDYDGAIEALNLVVKVDEDNVKALYRRGVARTKTGFLDDAKTDVMKAAKLAPTDKEIRKAIASLKEARERPRRKTKLCSAELLERSACTTRKRRPGPSSSPARVTRRFTSMWNRAKRSWDV